MTRGVRRLVALVTVVALAAAACGDDSSGDSTAGGGLGSVGRSAEAELVEHPRPETSLDFRACGSTTECATLLVPLDPADPDGPTIDLSVARRLATGPGPRQGVLVVNPGGPGASGVDYVSAVADLHGLNEWFDLVSWDPRGVGGSARLQCDRTAMATFRTADHAPTTAAAQAALDEAAAAFAESCAAGSGDLLDHLGTEATVADIEELRQALGEEQVSYLGLSYGTFIGQIYADRHPDRVRAMVLDGVVEPTGDITDLLRAQAVAFEEILAETLDSCADLGDACPTDDAGRLFDEVAASLGTDPVTLDDGRVVTPTALAIASLLPGYDPSLVPTYFARLGRAGDGDAAGLFDLADRYWTLGDYPAYIGTLCLDLVHPTDAAEQQRFAEELAEAAPRLGAPIANEVLPCVFWSTRRTEPLGPLRAADAPPILVVGNTGDAATPVELAEQVAERLDTGVLLIHDGEGHTSLASSPCVRHEVLTYLLHLLPPVDDTVCET
ncbi:MAG: alpha/beta fold hydrolase [Acidimicrobiia bacterium]|nr:alpha/beta fold hydrolase [Acidimicrobiia bacterium]